MFNRRGTRIASLAAATAALALGVLATTAQTGANAATTATAHTKPWQTTLHIHVSGCDKCSIELIDAYQGDSIVATLGKKVVGSDHEATFHLNKGQTNGLTFDVRAPWAKGIDYTPNAVTQYLGHKVGSAVSEAGAKKAGHATACWMGTHKSSKNLYFKVSRVHVSGTSSKAVAPLVYATHTMTGERPYQKADHGTIGNQEAYFCAAPKS